MKDGRGKQAEWCARNYGPAELVVFLLGTDSDRILVSQFGLCCYGSNVLYGAQSAMQTMRDKIRALQVW
ncbi:hypothetical protein O988_02691 [Pseudogymnoascus sp. VKM F-3808]|nr:hypothetical protein O988_02691 [Pseudogymnoascus sp. VKM F-3808]